MKNIILVSIVVLTSACFICYLYNKDEKEINKVELLERGNNKSSNRITKHFNMLIVPDLSNRIEKAKPISDLDIIYEILDNISYKYLKTQNRRIGQQDRFQIGFTNQSIINKHNVNKSNLLIDFSRFDKQRNRIEYLSGKNEVRNLSSDLNIFKCELERNYKSASKEIVGADIYTFLKKLNSSVILPKGILSNKITEDGRVLKHEYRNVIILLTDGYIEADRYTGDYIEKCIYPNLSQERINSFRSDFEKNNKGRTLKQFFIDRCYGITAVDNSLLSQTEILVLELDDRSVNNNGNATEDITDLDIIKLFWTDWLTKSNVKKFKLYDKAGSLNELQGHINRFLDQ